MKKIITFGLSLVLLAGGISSCKKTSKRKVSNDWKVVKYEEEYSSITSGSSLKIDGASAVKTSTNNGSISTSTGSVNDYIFSIKKDGTWQKESDITWSFGSNNTQNIKITDKGTWFFLGKNKTDKFKKNEKIVFVTKSSETITKNNFGGTLTSNMNSYTEEDLNYADVIYTVVESKSKKLVLETVTERTSSSSSTDYGDSASHGNGKVTITLEQ